MRYNKNLRILLMIAIICLFGGCGKNNRSAEKTDPMPNIVFMCISDLSEVASEGETLTSITFFDKNGNQYITDDHYLDGKSCTDICKQFSEGKLDDFLKLRMTCDTKDLYEQYKTLNKIAKKNDFKVDDAVENDLEIEAIRTTWVGLYYNDKKEVSALVLQTEDGNGVHYANDKDAVKMCEWYKDASIIKEK